MGSLSSIPILPKTLWHEAMSKCEIMIQDENHKREIQMSTHISSLPLFLMMSSGWYFGSGIFLVDRVNFHPLKLGKDKFTQKNSNFGMEKFMFILVLIFSRDFRAARTFGTTLAKTSIKTTRLVERKKDHPK